MGATYKLCVELGESGLALAIEDQHGVDHDVQLGFSIPSDIIDGWTRSGLSVSRSGISQVLDPITRS